MFQANSKELFMDYQKILSLITMKENSIKRKKYKELFLVFVFVGVFYNIESGNFFKLVHYW